LVTDKTLPRSRSNVGAGGLKSLYPAGSPLRKRGWEGEEEGEKEEQGDWRRKEITLPLYIFWIRP
jgi:hypothetical protein